MRTRKTRRAKNTGITVLKNSQEKSQPFFAPVIQPKLTIGHVDDPAEKEADAAAKNVMSANSDGKLQMKGSNSPASGIAAPPSVNEVITSPGQSLDRDTKSLMEERLGHNFGNVQIHNDSSAHRSSAEIDALAYTHDNHIAFGAGKYQPDTYAGKILLAHELAHVKQQQTGAKSNVVQKADLSSPRLAGNALFEDVFDNKKVIEYGRKGPEVRRIQQLLVDLGISLPKFFVDGDFKTETRNAVKEFQKRKGLVDDGRVGFKTIAALDAEFPAFSLPAKKADPWTMSCILSILCPWNKNLVEKVLPKFNIITYDSRDYPVERWDGTTWDTDVISAGGFRNGTNMGFLNTVSCQEMALIIYHEGWHAPQPVSLKGTVERETNAYINAEQWSIDIGVPGQEDFENAATGKKESFRKKTGSTTEVNEAAAKTFVTQEYGGVSTLPGERVIARDGATDVRVRKADGSEYVRPAKPGESILGKPITKNEKKVDPALWVCP